MITGSSSNNFVVILTLMCLAELIFCGSAHNHQNHLHQDTDEYHYNEHHNSAQIASSLRIHTNRASSSSIHRRLIDESKIQPCGAKDPTTSEMKEASIVVAKWMTNNFVNLNQIQSVEIDTYFHVITDGTIGILSLEDLQNQLNVLNDAFRPHGFSFRLQGTTFTNNTLWYYSDITSQDHSDMKGTLHVGDASTLNVYFNSPGFSGAGVLLGYATFPWEYASFPSEDGVVLLDGVTPGGGLTTRFDGGITLVHEVGHWLGLFHTFNTDFGFFEIINILLYLVGLRNGCNTSGDDVRDTPRQRSPSNGCPIGRNSCRFFPGLDPINNYMEYTDDNCRTEFTPGQSDRMWAMWNEYRAPRT